MASRTIITGAGGLIGQYLIKTAVIHCTAVSRTKDCEQDPLRARQIKVQVTAHLAQLSQDISFISLFSGEIFDGKTGWYRETDVPNPINVYGKTELEAETIVGRKTNDTR